MSSLPIVAVVVVGGLRPPRQATTTYPSRVIENDNFLTTDDNSGTER